MVLISLHPAYALRNGANHSSRSKKSYNSEECELYFQVRALHKGILLIFDISIFFWGGGGAGGRYGRDLRTEYILTNVSHSYPSEKCTAFFFR